MNQFFKHLKPIAISIAILVVCVVSVSLVTKHGESETVSKSAAAPTEISVLSKEESSKTQKSKTESSRPESSKNKEESSLKSKPEKKVTSKSDNKKDSAPESVQRRQSVISDTEPSPEPSETKPENLTEKIIVETAVPSEEQEPEPIQTENNVTENKPSTEQNNTSAYQPKSTAVHININGEMRAVWIPYFTLDMGGTDRSESAFRNKIDEIINTCVDNKLNTIIVQVRPFGDSIYPSEYFPFSHIISGTQGKNVNYDPLQYIVSAAHSKGLSVHAWVNPFRISTGTNPNPLADSNPYIKWKNDGDNSNNDYTFEYNGGIYYNPAYPEVRKLIIDGIAEIVKKYDVDGVQLDDYFYPSEETFYDSQTYNAYLDTIEDGYNGLSQADWRKTNINTLVSGIYSAVHSIDNNVMFGIAPQCNFDNNNKIGADIYTWCSQRGYIDYICPQIYVSNKHPTFPFATLADQWKKTVTESSVKLYFGLGIYKAGTDADSGTWLLADNNIKTQIELSRTLETNGFMLYSYDFLKNKTSEKEMKNALTVIK